MMPHECQWPVGDVEYCGKSAQHSIRSEEDDQVIYWLCSWHFDLMVRLLKQAAKWDDNIGYLMAKIVRKNRL
jgi:hypothetical protein